MSRRIIGLSLTLILGLSMHAMAQSGASRANGIVLDQDGNPVQGAVVTYVPQGNPTLKYSGKTNKKGRYFVSGLWTPKEGDMWDITIELEGYLPTEVTIESRTVNKVLISDVMTKKLRSTSKVPSIIIRPMGEAKVDFSVAPEEHVLAQQGQMVPAVEGADIPEAAAPEQEEKLSAWDEALTLASNGDLEGSAPLFVAAIDEEPDDVERRDTYAKVLLRLERYEEAGAELAKAVEIAPESLELRKLQAKVYMEAGDMAQAKQALQAAQEMAPEDLGILRRLAYVAAEADEPAEAIAAYERITAVNSLDSDAWLRLGGLYATTGEMKKSEQAYQKVAEINPESAPETFYNLGSLIMNRPDRGASDTQRAIDAFRQAVEIKPDYGAAWQQLAFALLGLGDQDGARKALESYVDLSPDAPDVAQMRGLIQTLQK